MGPASACQTRSRTLSIVGAPTVGACFRPRLVVLRGKLVLVFEKALMVGDFCVRRRIYQATRTRRDARARWQSCPGMFCNPPGLVPIAGTKGEDEHISLQNRRMISSSRSFHDASSSWIFWRPAFSQSMCLIERVAARYLEAALGRSCRHPRAEEPTFLPGHATTNTPRRTKEGAAPWPFPNGSTAAGPHDLPPSPNRPGTCLKRNCSHASQNLCELGVLISSFGLGRKGELFRGPAPAATSLLRGFFFGWAFEKAFGHLEGVDQRVSWFWGGSRLFFGSEGVSGGGVDRKSAVWRSPTAVESITPTRYCGPRLWKAAAVGPWEESLGNVRR